jgi:cobalt-zinc-cadmium resistance protein CzcA
VLNGVVLATAVREKLDSGWPLDEAILEGSTDTMRAVVTTGAVAAFGFLPMALATGAGAEVQRPLATVVICGILFSTALTLFLLPGVLRLALFVRHRERQKVVEPAAVDAEIA